MAGDFHLESGMEENGMEEFCKLRERTAQLRDVMSDFAAIYPAGVPPRHWPSFNQAVS